MIKTDSLTPHSIKCSSCNRRDSCFPLAIPPRDLPSLENLISTRKNIKRGAALYRMNEPLDSLFAIRSGFLKSIQLTQNGHEQIAGFHMAGEFLGFDGIATGLYTRDLIALEDTEVCVIPYRQLLQFAKHIPRLFENVLDQMGRELLREQKTISRLATPHASEKVASFIIDLSERYEARGFSKSEFILRMNRAEIGSFLGVKLETVSRVLSKFAQQGIIEVTQRRIRIIDHPRLRQTAMGASDDEQ